MKTKLLNRAFAVLFSFTLIIGLFPTIAFAANIAAVKINGVEMKDGVEVQYGEGTAVLDKANGTLTLNNATINQEGTTPVLRADNGELKIILIGENTITSTTQRPFYINSVDLTIQGTEKDSLIVKTDSDGLQIDQGNLIVDGCKIDITSSSYGGIVCWGGTLTIQNGANISIDSFENSLMCEYGLFITDSTVNATARSNYPDWSTCAVSSYGNISMMNSAVTATANGEEASAISAGGTISINNSEIEATTTSQNNAYPAFNAYGNIDITNHSSVTVNSAGTIGIWSSGGAIEIQDSIAYVAADDEWPAIQGDNGGATISGSWVETFGSKASPQFTSSDSVIFFNNEGTTSGSLALPGDVTVGKNMKLSIPEGSSITVPGGVTFTNHGQIELLGDLTVNGGTIACDSHSGGTATCENQAICSICGTAYGELAGHIPTKTNVKTASCTEEGYTGDVVCQVCGKMIEKGETIPKVAHNYKDGTCVLCGAAESPKTNDNNNVILWTALLFVSGSVFSSMIIRKKYINNK